MKRSVDMKEISDGKLYQSQDMVKADTGGCVGCSVCCHGMGDTIILDPYDGYRMSEALQLPFSALVEHQVALNLVDGLILPNLKMDGPDEACAFLNEAGRCTIHEARPGICRLFPLGRYYEGREFRYFLQVHECPRDNKTKVKIKKWLDTPQLSRYEEYIRQWHGFLEDAQQRLEGSTDENLRKQICMYLLSQFYLKPWIPGEDFYPQFEERLQEGRSVLG